MRLSRGLLLALLLLAGLATYVAWRRTVAARAVDPYALVPADAALVLTVRDGPTLARHLQDAGVWDKLTATRGWQQVAGPLALADSLDNGGRAASRRRGLAALLGGKRLVASWHETGGRGLDVLLQVPLTDVLEYRQARGLLEALGRDTARYRLRVRPYEGYELRELTQRASGVRLTVLNYRNHLLLSLNPALVEAVVQQLQTPRPAAGTAFSSTDLLRLREVEATLQVSGRRLPGLLDRLLQPGSAAALRPAYGLVREALLGLVVENGQLTLRGFANPEPGVAVAPAPAPLRPLAEVLPQQAALVLALGERPGPAGGAALDSLRATLAPGPTLVWLGAARPGPAPAPVVVLRCPRPARATAALARLRRLGGAGPAFERVGGSALYAAGFDPRALLGAAGAGLAPSPDPGAALAGGYLLLGERASLRPYLAALGAGQVWSRSAAQVAWLQQLQPQARLTLLADLRPAWNALLGALAEAQRPNALRNEALLRYFPQLSWQVVAPDAGPAEGQLFAQALLRRPSLAGMGAPLAGRPASEAQVLGRAGAALRGVPLLVAEAGGPPSAVVVSDSAGRLRALPLPGGPRPVAWADTLPGPAVPGTLQALRGRLLLATARRLHWVGPADGREAPGFPLTLPDTLTLAAVAGSAASPRLVVATAAADLLLLDTQGRRYPGWPRRLEAPLAGPPLLLTVGGRDVVVAALTNGYVYAFDQGGGRFPGFPVSAGARLGAPPLGQAGPTLARSVLRLVNQQGELLTFSLSGDLLSRRRVATWSPTSRFRLVAEATGRAGACVVVREDAGQLDVYDPAGGPARLHQALLTAGEHPVQWFDWGRGRQVLALTDPLPAQVSLFDGAGQALAAPLPSTAPGVALRPTPDNQGYLLLHAVRRELRQTRVPGPPAPLAQ